MKRPHVLLQIAALISSGMLAAGFVSYQAGAFNRLLAPELPPAAPGDTPTAEEKPTDDAPQPDLAIMRSSKSGTLTFTGKLSGTFSPSPSQKTADGAPPTKPEQPPADSKPPTIMMGPKSYGGPPINFNDPNLSLPQPPAPTGSSKPAP
jgi:hypothetical protein